MIRRRDSQSPTLPILELDAAGVVLTAEYGPGVAFGPRTLRAHEFVWLLEGTATWTRHHDAGVEQQHLAPGRLMLVPMGTIDSYQWDQQRTSRHAYAHFWLVDGAGLPPAAEWPRVRDLHRAPVLGALCDYLLELAALPGDQARARCDQLLPVLLDLFVRGPLEPTGDPDPGYVTAAVEVVRRAWARTGPRLVDADELAAAVGVSAGHLFRLFGQTYGCGPAHALELVRLSRAATLLLRSNATLAEVAAATGFANAYHLSRRFRAAYGTPPGRFRLRSDADPLAPVRAADLLGLLQALRR